MIGTTDLDSRFKYHAPPNEHVANAHEDVRHSILIAAKQIDILVPSGREKSLAITKLEEAMMWANAAIARNPGGQA